MDLRLFRILLKNLFVLRRGLLPVALRLECFSIELLRLGRLGSHGCELLGRARRQFGIEMRGGVEHLRIVRELAVQQQQSFHRSLGLINAHSAACQQHRRLKLQLLVGHAGARTLQHSDSFFAAPFFGESDSSLCLGNGVHCLLRKKHCRTAGQNTSEQ